MLNFQLNCFLQDSCSLNLDSTLDVMQACGSYFFQLPCHVPGLAGLLGLLSVLVDSEIFSEPGGSISGPVLLESTFSCPAPVCLLTPIPTAFFYIQQSEGYV